MPQDHKWQFYTDSQSAWDAMLADIRNAEHSIELEQFILSADTIGFQFIEALKERALKGIKVRILCDEVGSFGLSRSPILTSIIEAGIEIKFFNSIVPWSPNNQALWYFRDHRKILLVDDKVGYTGGVCIGDTMRNWRESSVRIEGSVVLDMMASYEVMWHKSYHKIKYYTQSKAQAKSDGAKSFNFVSNSPLPDKHYLYREFIRAIREARHYIYLTTPYFLPDSRLLKGLKRAVGRGVEVRILVPHTTNYKILDLGMSTFFYDLLTHGIKIFQYPKSKFIHAKTGVVDGSWSTIGSMNLDNLSLRYNFEGNIVSTDRKFTFDLEKQFLDDLKDSPELSLKAWQNRSLYHKILEIFVWPVRKLL